MVQQELPTATRERLLTPNTEGVPSAQLQLPPGPFQITTPPFDTLQRFWNILSILLAPREFFRAMEQYGDVYRMLPFIGSDVAMVSGVENLKQCWAYEKEGKLVQVSPPVIQQLMGKENLNAIEGEDHARMRRLYMSAFTQAALMSYVPTVEDIVDKYVDRWVAAAREGRQLDLSSDMKLYTLEVAWKVLCGQASISDDKLQQLSESFMAWVKGLAAPWTKGWVAPFNIYDKALEAKDDIMQFAASVVDAKRAMSPAERAASRKDVVDYLLSARMTSDGEVVDAESADAGKDADVFQMSDQAIADNVLLTLFAGHDTSSSTLGVMLVALASNPQVLKDLRKELDDAAQGRSRIPWPELRKLPFLDAVITETLRWEPIVVQLSRMAEEDLEIGGYLVPKGWQVDYNLFATNQDGSVFSDPSFFDPYRHLQGQINGGSPVPFGGGKRVCPGAELARLEMKMLLDRFVREVEFEAIDASSLELSRFPNPFPASKGGFKARLTERVVEV
ncbi:unnamed protein product [Vitrella brassicaformis CCMP3155]|uniref:Cytochrome P450 n=1 Tax=Vitrella brassicaformis (strain CCMP3155) TaxID=1169540 RepID=A0A0G4EEK5_VITBC|nr:unnamed protein product [Vitrella brassicaformis CCMP3155]|eukprot:CEL94106.1 unnamed protein product [Vitrella brassicaformis CCMP3155]